MPVINESSTLNEYNHQMQKVLRMIYPDIDPTTMNEVIQYSVNKRYKDEPAQVNNSYTKRIADMNLLKIADYIKDREPIVTAYGTMFKKHGDVPNPMLDVIQSFLDKRNENKRMMFTFPKGSENFEKYNLLQALTI